MSADDVPAFLEKTHTTLSELSQVPSDGEAHEDTASPREYTPAVSVRESLASEDRIFSLTNGKKYRTLRRHLPGQGLTRSGIANATTLRYPMVAENYLGGASPWRTGSASARRPPGQGSRHVCQSKASTAVPEIHIMRERGAVAARSCEMLFAQSKATLRGRVGGPGGIEASLRASTALKAMRAFG